VPRWKDSFVLGTEQHSAVVGSGARLAIGRALQRKDEERSHQILGGLRAQKAFRQYFYGVTVMLSVRDWDWAPAPLVEPVTVTE
jgi:hypothetical protein